jgi:hypothetical protein
MCSVQRRVDGRLVGPVGDVERDHARGAELARGAHRHRLDEAAVDEVAAVDADRLVEGRHARGGGDREAARPAVEHDASAGLQVGGDRREPGGPPLDRPSARVALDERCDRVAAQQSAARQSGPHPGQPAERVGLGADPVGGQAERPERTGDRARARADDEVRHPAAGLHRADHADVDQPVPRAAAEREGERVSGRCRALRGGLRRGRGALRLRSAREPRPAARCGHRETAADGPAACGAVWGGGHRQRVLVGAVHARAGGGRTVSILGQRGAGRHARAALVRGMPDPDRRASKFHGPAGLSQPSARR